MHSPLLLLELKMRDTMLKNGPFFPLDVYNLLQGLRQVQNMITQKSNHFGMIIGLSWEREGEYVIKKRILPLNSQLLYPSQRFKLQMMHSFFFPEIFFLMS